MEIKSSLEVFQVQCEQSNAILHHNEIFSWCSMSYNCAKFLPNNFKFGRKIKAKRQLIYCCVAEPVK